MDAIAKIEITKQVLLELLDDPENGDADIEAINHVLTILPST